MINTPREHMLIGYLRAVVDSDKLKRDLPEIFEPPMIIGGAGIDWAVDSIKKGLEEDDLKSDSQFKDWSSTSFTEKRPLWKHEKAEAIPTWWCNICERTIRSRKAPDPMPSNVALQCVDSNGHRWKKQ